MPQGDDTTKHSLWGELQGVLTLSLPIIITMLSHTAMQFVDAMMLGRYGRNELAAVTPAGLAFFTMAVFLIGLVGCNNTFVAQSLGRGNLKDCSRYTVHALCFGLAAQVLILPLYLRPEMIFGLLPHEPEVQALEITYFRARSFQLAATGMIVALSTFYQATGKARIPMFTGIAANSLNILGDYLLIFGKFGLPEWGIFGAGVATTACAYVEVALLILVFLSPSMHARFGTRRWLPFELAKFKQILKIGLWTGIRFFLDLASWTIFTAAFVGKLGSNILAGNNAASQILHLSLMPAIGLNIGITAIVGRHIGKGDIPGAKRKAYLGMATACCYMTVMGALFFIFRGPLIRLFSQEPEVIASGGIILMYVALFQFADAFGILSSGALRGAGDTKFPAILQLLLAWFFFLPTAMVLSRKDVLAVHGAWLSVTAYVWILGIALFLRFRSERWRKINIFK